MSTLLRFLPALACAGVMVVCMRGMLGKRPTPTIPEARDEELLRLRSEVEDLRQRVGPAGMDGQTDAIGGLVDADRDPTNASEPRVP